MWLANRLHFIFKTEYYSISLEHAFSTLWKPEWLTRSQKSLLHVKLSKNFPVGKKYSLPKESSSLQHFSTSSIWWSSISSSKGWLPFRSELKWGRTLIKLSFSRSIQLHGRVSVPVLSSSCFSLHPQYETSAALMFCIFFLFSLHHPFFLELCLSLDLHTRNQHSNEEAIPKFGLNCLRTLLSLWFNILNYISLS